MLRLHRALIGAPLGAAAVLGSALVGCSDAPVAAPPAVERGLAFWVELVEPAGLGERFAFAGEHGLTLHLALEQGVHDRAYLAGACAAAAAHSVPLRLWPLLPKAGGYWAGQSNAPAFLAWTDELVGWAESDCPTFAGVEVDLEMAYDRVQTLQAMRGAGADLAAIAEFMQSGVDEAAFEAARSALADGVDALHARGVDVGLSTLPMNADDWADGDEGIGKMFGTPIDGIAWDRVSFQVYRSLYDAQFPPKSGAPYGPGLVASYAASIVERFGARAAIDLGTTGSGIGIPEGLPSAEALRADLAAALAEGIAPGNIAVYSLEGLDGRPDPERWVTQPPAQRALPTEDDEEPRGVFRALDSLQP